jgi:predicted NAD/FAD-binding protein
MEIRKPTVAIVGSGISGLTAAYFLKENYEVCVMERSSSLGMGAHGVQVHGAVVDVPLRFFDYHYYPNLIKLYIEAGVQFSSRSYSFSAVDFLTQRVLWRCHSVRSKFGTSRLTLDLWTMAKHCFRSIRVFFQITRFKRSLKDVHVANLTLGEFLQLHKYSDDFVYLVLVPFLSVTCTCSYTEVLNMPMDVVADYFASSGTDYNLQRFRIDGCTNDACAALSRGCEVLLKVEVLSVRSVDSQVQICYRNVGEPDGAVLTRMFDQVVIAVEAPYVPPLLLTGNEMSDREILETFACFRYAKTRVVTHTDSTLMPRERRHWSLLNFLLDGDRGQMTSVRMNDLIPGLGRSDAAVFQTWNPLTLPDPASVLADSTFLRALVTKDSARGVQKLKALQGKNNIYYVGAYSLYSFTLLENGCRSTMQVVARMGCTSKLLCRCSSMTCACPRALPSIVQQNDRYKGEISYSGWSFPGVSIFLLASVALFQRARLSNVK